MSGINGVVVVTGGASGIGEACAREIAARGARVVVADLNLAGAETVARSIDGKARKVDVEKEAEIEALATEIEKSIGPVTGLVTSAGVIQSPLPPEELAIADWDRVVRIDQRGVYLSCVAFGGRMAKRGRGSIVNIASITASRSAPLHSYAPVKAAVVAMSECLAAEWGRSGVRVNSISPGFTRTPALQAAIDKGERDPRLLSEAAALGRMVETPEVAKAVAFLLSDESSAITGIDLPVDCGWLVAPSWATWGGLRKRR
ncbi:MAG: SDR family oxidoreductase [Alphaproteobacteria bacterium]|nr:SDR family oxidoreductase [Alphaproteobacteria bacterium]